MALRFICMINARHSIFLNQFSRTQLVFGEEAMQRLAEARVAVFGIGGVGGYTVEALARSGIGQPSVSVKTPGVFYIRQ